MPRNPNGYGSVVRLSGNRRRPFMARKTIGWDDRAFPIYAVIGYYENRKDAMIALARYNADPYDVDLVRLTFRELFEKWSATELPKLGESLQNAHRAAYSYCRHLGGIEYRKLRKLHMQECIDKCGRSESTQRNIKNLFTQLDRYAFDQDIISKCYSTNLTTRSTETKQRTPFTKAEIQELETQVGSPIVDETLFMLYTGCRVREMLTVRSRDIDLTARTIVLGVKTDAGRDRIVPIHRKLVPIIENHIGGEYLFDHPRSTTAEHPERALQTKFLTQFGNRFPSHDTHDCRHTFRSQLDRQGANAACMNLIMGHKSRDIGERVYTHKTVQELVDTIDLLDYSV